MYDNSRGYFGNNGQRSYNRPSSSDRQSTPKVVAPYEKLTVDNYIDQAEKVMNQMFREDPRNPNREVSSLSTSKIRNLLAMSAEILFKATEAQARNEKDLSASLKTDLGYLRIRCAYEIGREKSVDELNNKANLINHIKNIKNVSECILFCHYLEALVAYHKFHGGQD